MEQSDIFVITVIVCLVFFAVLRLKNVLRKPSSFTFSMGDNANVIFNYVRVFLKEGNFIKRGNRVLVFLLGNSVFLFFGGLASISGSIDLRGKLVSYLLNGNDTFKAIESCSLKFSTNDYVELKKSCFDNSGYYSFVSVDGESINNSWEGLRHVLSDVNPQSITLVFYSIILILFMIDLLTLWTEKHIDFKEATTAVGILGTFAGVFVGLNGFDFNDINNSISTLVQGIKISIETSIAGLFSSIVLLILHKVKLYVRGDDSQ